MSGFHLDVAVRIRSILSDEIDRSLDQSISQSIDYLIKEADGRTTLAISTPKINKSSAPTRPSIKQSIKQTSKQLSDVSISSKSDQSIKQKADQSIKSYRGFASVLDQSTTNINVYNTVLKPLVDRVLQGETACCFAYGHTGSGQNQTRIIQQSFSYHFLYHFVIECHFLYHFWSLSLFDLTTQSRDKQLWL